MKIRVKLQKRKTKNPSGYHEIYQITVPKGIVEEMGWEKGDVLEFDVLTLHGCVRMKRVVS